MNTFILLDFTISLLEFIKFAQIFDKYGTGNLHKQSQKL